MRWHEASLLCHTPIKHEQQKYPPGDLGFLWGGLKMDEEVVCVCEMFLGLNWKKYINMNVTSNVTWTFGKSVSWSWYSLAALSCDCRLYVPQFHHMAAQQVSRYGWSGADMGKGDNCKKLPIFCTLACFVPTKGHKCDSFELQRLWVLIGHAELLTAEVAGRHRRTTAPPAAEAQFHNCWRSSDEWSHDMIWYPLISHVGKKMKWFKVGESWWGPCQSDDLRAPSQAGRLWSVPRDIMICEILFAGNWCMYCILLCASAAYGCIFSRVWTSFALTWLTWAAVGTRTTQPCTDSNLQRAMVAYFPKQVLLQTRQPLQVDGGRPFSGHDSRYDSSFVFSAKRRLIWTNLYS